MIIYLKIVLLSLLAITIYTMIASFVYGCARSLNHLKSDSVFIGIGFPIVIPIYLIFFILGRWMSVLGSSMMQRMLLRAKKELEIQQRITKELQETNEEIDKAFKIL